MEKRTRKPREAFLEHAPTGHFFDEFTQTFTFGPPSRRQALRLLAGGALAAVFGPAVALEEAGAVEVMRTDKSCAGTPAISNTVCPRPRACRRRFCACARNVGGDKKCIDLRTAHCPTVDECDGDRDCPSGAVCVKVGACCGNKRRQACFRQCPH
jgi:hypothetical protein